MHHFDCDLPVVASNNATMSKLSSSKLLKTRKINYMRYVNINEHTYWDKRNWLRGLAKPTSAGLCLEARDFPIYQLGYFGLT